jgi:hypothetical protein
MVAISDERALGGLRLRQATLIVLIDSTRPGHVPKRMTVNGGEFCPLTDARRNLLSTD